VGEHCNLCLDAFAETFAAREMMFGTGGAYAYGRCRRCGAFSIVDQPDDMAPFYPGGYYSMTPRSAPADAGLAARVKAARTRALLRMPPAVVRRLEARGLAQPFHFWLASRRVSPRSAVCDVGSGGGETLVDMARQGFTNLLGIDPFLDEDRLLGAVRLRQCSLEDLDGQFDVLMLHHAFEHMDAPRDVLALLRERLAPGGTIVIRVPVADSDAAETYGADWVQLDAPRHFTIPTDDGMSIVAEAAGLRVLRSFRDSYALQFWASEQYRLGIPLRDPRSWAENPDASSFDQAQIDAWEQRSEALNDCGRGDSAGYVLTHA